MANKERLALKRKIAKRVAPFVVAAGIAGAGVGLAGCSEGQAQADGYNGDITTTSSTSRFEESSPVTTEAQPDTSHITSRVGVDTTTTTEVVKSECALPDVKEAEEKLEALGVTVNHVEGNDTFDHKLRPDEYFLVPTNSIIVGDVEILVGFEGDQPVWDRSNDNREQTGAITDVRTAVICHGLPEEWEGFEYGDGKSVANIHLGTGAAIRETIITDDAIDMITVREPDAELVHFFRCDQKNGFWFVGTLTASEINSGKVGLLLRGEYQSQEVTVYSQEEEVTKSEETVTGEFKDVQLAEGESITAPANSIVLGDVKVFGKARYDSNDKTGLIVELPNGGEVFAEWGASIISANDPELYNKILERELEAMKEDHASTQGFKVDVITVTGPNDSTRQGR